MSKEITRELGLGGPGVLTLGREGTLPAGTMIGGPGLSLNLPDGFTVKTGASGNVGGGVVAASGRRRR